MVRTNDWSQDISSGDLRGQLYFHWVTVQKSNSSKHILKCFAPLTLCNSPILFAVSPPSRLVMNGPVITYTHNVYFCPFLAQSDRNVPEVANKLSARTWKCGFSLTQKWKLGQALVCVLCYYCYICTSVDSETPLISRSVNHLSSWSLTSNTEPRNHAQPSSSISSVVVLTAWTHLGCIRILILDCYIVGML